MYRGIIMLFYNKTCYQLIYCLFLSDFLILNQTWPAYSNTEFNSPTVDSISPASFLSTTADSSSSDRFNIMFNLEKLLDRDAHNKIGRTINKFSKHLNYKTCYHLHMASRNPELAWVRDTSRELISEKLSEQNNAESLADNIDSLNAINIDDKKGRSELSPHVLDRVYSLFKKRQNASHDVVRSVLPCANLLVAHKYYADEGLLDVFDFLNACVNTDARFAMKPLVDSIKKNDSYYKKNMPEQTSGFMSKLFDKIKSDLAATDGAELNAGQMRAIEELTAELLYANIAASYKVRIRIDLLLCCAVL